MTNKKETMTKTNTKTKTMTKTNTFREHIQRAILETFDMWQTPPPPPFWEPLFQNQNFG